MTPINGFNGVLNTEDYYYSEVAFKIAFHGNLPFLPTETLYARPQKRKKCRFRIKKVTFSLIFN